MTLLPTKHVPTGRSLIGIGALLLRQLHAPTTVSALWELVKDEREIPHFGVFVLSLDYLYMIGAIQFADGLVKRSQR